MLGLLLGASHASLRADFEVSTPELDLLVDLAVTAEGAIGARLTGAGFGGCTVNLVRTGSVDTFRESVAAEYHRQTGLNAEAHVCRAVDGLRVTYA
jgi:galactokinase